MKLLPEPEVPWTTKTNPNIDCKPEETCKEILKLCSGVWTNDVSIERHRGKICRYCGNNGKNEEQG